jgi:hypothetical protein
VLRNDVLKVEVQNVSDRDFVGRLDRAGDRLSVSPVDVVG